MDKNCIQKVILSEEMVRLHPSIIHTGSHRLVTTVGSDNGQHMRVYILKLLFWTISLVDALEVF